MYSAFQPRPASLYCQSEKAFFIFTRLKGIRITSVRKQSASMWEKAIISSSTCPGPSVT